MKLPNFLIIGAPKAGTTSMYAYLQQHPQIFMSPQKETYFFAFDDKKSLKYNGWGMPPPIFHKIVDIIEHYWKLFADVSDEVAIGETTLVYFYDQGAPQKIHAINPHMKLIAILRNPVDRAYSHYQDLIRQQREPIRK